MFLGDTYVYRGLHGLSAKINNLRGFSVANSYSLTNYALTMIVIIIDVAPVAVDLSYSGSGVKEFEEEEDGFTVDFDVLGFMRDQDKYQRIRSTGVLNFTDEDVSNVMTARSDGHELILCMNQIVYSKNADI